MATKAWFDDDDVRTSLRRILSQHRCVLHSFRDPVVSDEEAFASLKAGMDNLPPGTKMFLNSGAYANGSIPFSYSNDPIRNEQANSMGSIRRVPTSSFSRASLRDILLIQTRRSSP
jgi:hypothetical protein